jgi:hypothetical protein
MPNGGVPLHLVLHPLDKSPYVVHCQGADLRVVPREAWERAGAGAAPILSLSAEGARVLERFLRYWLRDAGDGPLYEAPGVDVAYDY